MNVMIENIKIRLATASSTQKLRCYNQDVKFLIEELERMERQLQSTEDEKHKQQKHCYTQWRD